MSIISGSSGGKGQDMQAMAAATAAGKTKAKKTSKAPKHSVPIDKADISTPQKASSKPSPSAKELSGASTESIGDTKNIPGLFSVVQKGDKYFLSLTEDQLNKPFFFSANVSKSVGEKRLVGSELGDAQLAEFRKVGSQIQLVAKQTANFAAPGTPQEKFTEEGFSDSLISSAPITPTNGLMGGILVDVGTLLFSDVIGYQQALNRAYGVSFAADIKNTSVTAVTNSPEQTSFGVQAHYSAPSVVSSSASLPSTTPIDRSVLTEFRYNFMQLPDQPMKPRLADERIGHFVTTRKDYTGDEGDGVVRYVNRWRLEKKNPDAELSDPVKPITYWIANNVPEEYRDSVKDGILEWNKAFEKIGFNNAIEVKQQPMDSDFDTLDAAHASVRWYTAADVGSAVGPSQVDPRSGEILDADIRMADVFGRSAKRFLSDNPDAAGKQSEGYQIAGQHQHGHACEFAAEAAIEHEFASNLLQARGDIESNKELAKAYVKDVVMHEVGHTLGLRHNFRGSTAYTAEQLQDPEFTKANGLGSSIMDYQPFNLAATGEKQGELVQSTLGPYDYLAIEYAYSPLSEQDEAKTLSEIAKKTTTDPLYAYESDELADSSDPGVNRFDLGKDPLLFAEKQFQLGEELLERAQSQELPDGTSYTELTRAFNSGLNSFAKSARLATRFVGGVTIRRDRAGTGNAVHEPVAADKQKEALKLVVDKMFQPDSLKFKPEFVARLGKERFGSWGDQNIHVGQNVLRIQSLALKDLLASDVAQRLIDNPEKLAADVPTLALSEVYDTIQNAIWSELDKGQEISQARRDLQREYLKSALAIIAPDSKAPGEAISIMSFLASKLKDRVDAAAKAAEGKSLEYQAHLKQVSQTLASALKAEA